MTRGKARRTASVLGRLALVLVAIFVGNVGYQIASSPRATHLKDPEALKRKLGHPVPAVVLGMNSPAIVDRALLGAKLWKLGLVAYFIASGGQVHNETEPESATLKRELTLLGVPVDRIVEESASRDTWQNLEFSKALLRERHDFQTPVLILTHDFHGFRASKMAQKLGFQATVITVPGKAAHWRAGAVVYETFWYLVWSVIVTLANLASVLSYSR